MCSEGIHGLSSWGYYSPVFCLRTRLLEIIILWAFCFLLDSIKTHCCHFFSLTVLLLSCHYLFLTPARLKFLFSAGLPSQENWRFPVFPFVRSLILSGVCFMHIKSSCVLMKTQYNETPAPHLQLSITLLPCRRPPRAPCMLLWLEIFTIRKRPCQRDGMQNPVISSVFITGRTWCCLGKVTKGVQQLEI